MFSNIVLTTSVSFFSLNDNTIKERERDDDFINVNNSTFAPLIHQNYNDTRLIFINSPYARPSIHPRVDTFDPSSRIERS